MKPKDHKNKFKGKQKIIVYDAYGDRFKQFKSGVIEIFKRIPIFERIPISDRIQRHNAILQKTGEKTIDEILTQNAFYALQLNYNSTVHNSKFEDAVNLLYNEKTITKFLENVNNNYHFCFSVEYILNIVKDGRYFNISDESKKEKAKKFIIINMALRKNLWVKKA